MKLETPDQVSLRPSGGQILKDWRSVNKCSCKHLLGMKSFFKIVWETSLRAALPKFEKDRSQKIVKVCTLNLVSKVFLTGAAVSYTQTIVLATVKLFKRRIETVSTGENGQPHATVHMVAAYFWGTTAKFWLVFLTKESKLTRESTFVFGLKSTPLM